MPNRFPKNFSFRLTDGDAARLKQVAGAHGYRSSEWARKILSESVGLDFDRRAVTRRILHAQLLADYLRELAAQGNNLNQLTHELNKGGRLMPPALQKCLEDIRYQNEAIMIRILDALGAGEAP